ncbi:MAG: enoyl-CoA hydratase/isomerase family protein [Ectothiorhodospiraceae bacterium]|nr:enoyl-CoA hydratase/isomerase family protein [Ectothiorhodospiraceae bacterium]
MGDSLVIRTDDNGLTTLTLNRPEKLNALNGEMFAMLRQHVDDIAKDASVGCVVLAGEGRSFCAGHDLATVGGGGHGPGLHFEAETIDAIEALPQPTIARLQGHCLTGGLELALGCDLLVAAESAVIGDTHGQWGLVPIWGMSVRLPERVGRSRAKELMFTSRRLSGPEALSFGLVDHCVPQEKLDEAIASLASEILKNSGGTNRIDKALLAAGAKMSREEALLYERGRPFGVPSDMGERMSRARK